jgi:hypothetical protein
MRPPLRPWNLRLGAGLNQPIRHPRNQWLHACCELYPVSGRSYWLTPAHAGVLAKRVVGGVPDRGWRSSQRGEEGVSVACHESRPVLFDGISRALCATKPNSSFVLTKTGAASLWPELPRMGEECCHCSCWSLPARDGRRGY